MKWQQIILTNGQVAIAPEIISASRATDIPAFYAQWFFNRLEKGCIEWVNPFNGKSQFVSFDNTRLVVFWTKNPKPIIPYLKMLDKKKINYYFLFTLNDYDKEGYEMNLPSVETRMATFIELSDLVGKEKVIWRFDPILLSDVIDSQLIVEKFKNIGSSIGNHTQQMIFSFADIEKYKKVQANLNREKIRYYLPGKEEKFEIVGQLSELCKNWGIAPSACAQAEDYSKFNVKVSKCIDADLIAKLFSYDKQLMDFLQPPERQNQLFDCNYDYLKDKGQRKNCGCIKSKDIGMYNTCPHLCSYCYANSSQKTVIENFESHSPENSKIINKF